METRVCLIYFFHDCRGVVAVLFVVFWRHFCSPFLLFLEEHVLFHSRLNFLRVDIQCSRKYSCISEKRLPRGRNDRYNFLDESAETRFLGTKEIEGCLRKKKLLSPITVPLQNNFFICYLGAPRSTLLSVSLTRC